MLLNGVNDLIIHVGEWEGNGQMGAKGSKVQNTCRTGD